ncbi:MAG: hypothetical protein ABH896_05130 [Candidatus Jacksonbacteria bacterium]
MGIIRYKNPTECSFYFWINQCPDSFHPLDMKRFYTFIKTVCRYNSKKWKSRDYLKKRIFDEKPHFDTDSLENILSLYKNLLDFHRANPFSSNIRNDLNIQRGYYIEKRVKHGKFYEKELPFDYPKGGILVYDKNKKI